MSKPARRGDPSRYREIMVAPFGYEELVGRSFGLSFLGATVLGFWLLMSLLRSGGR